jgi:hypothetical protein
MTYQCLLGMRIYAVVALCVGLALGMPVTKVVADEIKESIGDLGKINDPVQDAKQAYSNGIKEFVGITLEKGVLIPGLKTAQEALVRKSYIVRSLNHRWESFANIEDDPRRMYQLKRYANRYNMMMMKLIEQNELKQKRQYRY